jgi:hypothetical protein
MTCLHSSTLPELPLLGPQPPNTWTVPRGTPAGHQVIAASTAKEPQNFTLS